MPSAKTVARILGRIESRALGKLFHDSGHVNWCKAGLLNLAVAIDGAKGRAVRHARVFEPGLNRPNWARIGIRPIRDADLAAHAFLIGLTPAQSDGKAVAAESQVHEIERYKFRAPKCAREPEQD
jgi:hypothetical protein